MQQPAFCNEQLAAEVGMVAATLKSVDASETNNLGYRKCIISGMHTDAVKDVKQQALFPHKALRQFLV